MALKILLADDSMTAQNMGKKILLDAGYEVVAVSNGAAAIKRIASDRPDIIIVDEYMPGYTGSEVCERVKNSPDMARTPVLLTVGKMEPFSPDKANKVRADGVLIKPFEATDLIAVIQSIANKMSTGATTAAPTQHETTVQIASPVAVPEHTVRITSPTHEEHRDTVRIPPPHDAQPQPAYEETLRLTPEQIRAFQDKTYKDWVASAEVEREDQHVVEVSPEMPVIPPVVAEEPEPLPVEAAEAPSIYEPVVHSIIEEEPQPAMPLMTGLDSTEAPIARAMAGKMGQDFFTVAPSSPAAASEAAEAAPAFFASSVEHLVETPAQPVFSIQSPEPQPLDVVSESPVIAQASSLELETSAPQTPGPAFVAQLEELEATIAPPEPPVVAEVAPELEINSPIHLQDHVDVAADPGLVTSEDDMSQFVTSFGQPGAEEVPVGIASDLPPEQLAAITAPVLEEEIKQEVPELEPPDVVVPPMVELEPVAPVLQESVDLEPGSVVVEAPTNVLEEVGTIESEAALSGTGPMVAYVPGIEDTQPIPPFVATQSAVEETVAPEPVTIPEAEPVSEVESEHPLAVEPAVAIAEAKTVEFEAPVFGAPVMEAAAAAAVGGAALAGAAHFFSVSEPTPQEPVSEAPFAEAQAEVAMEPEVPVVPALSPEPVGDAALAEELAAALAEKEAEEHATAAADAAIASAVEPAVAAAVESSSSEHMIADTKLSEAVSHALEKLRPQLIAEIMKELFK